MASATFARALELLVRDGDIPAINAQTLDAALEYTWAVLEHYGILKPSEAFEAFRDEQRALFEGNNSPLNEWQQKTPALTIWKLMKKRHREALTEILLAPRKRKAVKRALEPGSDDNERRVRVKKEVEEALLRLLEDGVLPKEMYTEIVSNLPVRPLLKRWFAVSKGAIEIANEVFPLIFKRDITANLDLREEAKETLPYSLTWTLTMRDGLPLTVATAAAAENASPDKRRLLLGKTYAATMGHVCSGMIECLGDRARTVWKTPSLRGEPSGASFLKHPGGPLLFSIEFPDASEELDMTVVNHVPEGNDWDGPAVQRFVAKFVRAYTAYAHANRYRYVSDDKPRFPSLTRDLAYTKAMQWNVRNFLTNCLMEISPALTMTTVTLQGRGYRSEGGVVGLCTNGLFRPREPDEDEED